MRSAVKNRLRLDLHSQISPQLQILISALPLGFETLTYKSLRARLQNQAAPWQLPRPAIAAHLLPVGDLHAPLFPQLQAKHSDVFGLGSYRVLLSLHI
ncbi:MAG: hypothetical protein DWP95_02550 [Proteobacteria bacterium]|nr:MAG: hypothetical protein DWP95_02550 [Pseudomonadota bacterium]